MNIDSRQFDEPVTIDSKWLPGHEDESIFAKFNSEVLTLIHEEKRFPTKEELAKFSEETLAPEFKFDFASFSLFDTVERNYESVGNLWGDLAAVTGPGENITFDLSGTSPAAGNTTVTTYGEPVPWNGITWTDFVESAELENTSYRASALSSTKGVTKQNLEHRLI